MNWVKAKDKLPEHRQEVLIRHQTIIDLAIFDAERKKFILKSGEGIDKKDDVSWLALETEKESRR